MQFDLAGLLDGEVKEFWLPFHTEASAQVTEIWDWWIWSNREGWWLGGVLALFLCWSQYRHLSVNSHGARPVHLIMTMIKWIRTKNSLSSAQVSKGGWGRIKSVFSSSKNSDQDAAERMEGGEGMQYPDCAQVHTPQQLNHTPET